jgi:hypothetical protein
MIVTGEDPQAVLIASALLSIAYCVAAAFGAGIIAGAATINWIPQGLGVAGGLLVIPLLLLLVFAPESLAVYMIIVVLTTGITMVGAFLGHKLLPPSRVQKSLAEIRESRAPEQLAVG